MSSPRSRIEIAISCLLRQAIVQFSIRSRVRTYVKMLASRSEENIGLSQRYYATVNTMV
jgi:hypothetical protein